MASIYKNSLGITVVEKGESIYTFQLGASVYSVDGSETISIKPSGNESALLLLSFDQLDVASRYGAGNLTELIRYFANNNFFSLVMSCDGTSDAGSGFIDYNDASTSETPVNLLADEWTTIPNDGQGAFSNRLFKPSNVTELLDVSTGAIDASELSLGNVLLIRNDYIVTPSINNSLLEFRYSLGTGGGSYTLSQQVDRLDSGAGAPYRKALSIHKIYLGDNNTKDNPIVLQVKLSSSGTLVNNGTVISVIK